MSEQDKPNRPVAIQIVGGVKPPALAPEPELAPTDENFCLLPVKRTPGTDREPAEPAEDTVT